jgi:hypothetical protein
MKKILLATVAAIPLLAAGMAPGTAQDMNKQRGQAGVSQSQGGGQEKRGAAPGAQQQSRSSSGQAEGGSKMTQGAQEKNAQPRTQGRAEPGADQSRQQGGKQAQDQAKSRQDQQNKQAQDQAKSKQDQSKQEQPKQDQLKTTGQATTRQDQNVGSNNKSHANQDQNKTKGAQNQNQNQRQTRGAQNERKNQNEPAQTTGTTGTTGQSNRPENDRSQNQRTEQNQRGPQQNAQGQNRGNEAGGRVTLNEEQRTRVQKEVLSGRDVPRVDRVDFAINTGVVVPERVRVREVPSVLIDIHPEWRSDEYFVANDEIIIVDRGRHIIGTVPVGSSSGSVETRGSTVGLAGNVDIREVQQVLIHKGFYHGRVDGVMGRETMDALMVFQRREGVEATGRIDERTITALGISGRSEGRGNVEGRGEQGRFGPDQDRSTTTGQGDRDLNNNKGAQDRNQPRQNQNGRPSTSGQAKPADNNGKSNNAQGAQDRAKDRQNNDRQNTGLSTSGQGGTQGQSERQSTRPQNQSSATGGNEQRRKPGER